MIAFQLDDRSAVPTYVQLAQQVRHAVRYGMLRAGDQLPTARAVVETLAINPNTVLKAYRELEREGLLRSRPGAGTFVADSAPRPVSKSVHEPLRRALERWLRSTRRAGLDRESVISLFTHTIRDVYAEDVA